MSEIKNKFIIPEWEYTRREITVVDILYGFNLDLKSFLNIGFRQWNNPKNHWWIEVCEANDIDWHIMEIFQPNIDKAIEEGCPEERIFLGDIMDVCIYGDYDCILFWHGPEHVQKRDFMNNLDNIEQKAKKVLFFGMPLGEHRQRAVYGNPHEEHVSTWYPQDWIDLGYSVIPVIDSTWKPHITAYKIFL